MKRLNLLIKQLQKLIPNTWDKILFFWLIINFLLISFLFVIRYYVTTDIQSLFALGIYSLILGIIFYKETLYLIKKDTENSKNRVGFILVTTILYYFITAFVYDVIKLN